MSNGGRLGSGPIGLVIGYQGFGNVGDEAILTGIESLLAHTPVRVTGVVCGPAPASVAAFRDASRIVAPRLWPSRRGLDALRGADVLVIAGGGLFHDHWPLVIPRYLAWIILARLLGKRVVWIGVGVGPIRRRTFRLLTRIAAGLSSFCLVRDRRSAHLIGGESRAVMVMPDPAYFNAIPRPTAATARELAIIIRGPTPRNMGLAQGMAAALAATHRVAIDRGWQPRLMTMAGPADAAFAADVQRRVRESGADVDVEPLGPTPDQALRRLGQTSGVISIRLHGLVLASLVGVPCVPVTYDDKVSAAAEELGIADLAVSASDLDASALLDRLTSAGSPGRRGGVRDRVAAMRERMPAIAAALSDATGIGR